MSGIFANTLDDANWKVVHQDGLETTRRSRPGGFFVTSVAARRGSGLVPDLSSKEAR
jgi:hypothetical protein